MRMKVAEWVREYCVTTSQHGYKYTSLPGLSILERLLWCVVLVTGMVVSAFIVRIEWGKNQRNPTLIALDTAHYPIWKIEFPAVTICSINRISKSKAKDLSRKLVVPADMSRDQLYQDILLLTQLIDMGSCNTTELRRLQSVLDLNKISAERALRKVMSPCEDLIVRCMFKGVIKDCTAIFGVLKTPHGFCCSFNYHGSKLHNSMSILSPSGINNPYRPARTSACGFQMGLSVLINNHNSDYHDTSLASYGVRVLIHNPFEFPNYNTDERLVGADTMMMVSVYPEKFITTDPVRSLGLRRRGCQSKTEKRLRNLHEYSYSNCIVECRHNYTVRLCGCSPFFYPDLGQQRRCNLSDVPCLYEHRHALLEMDQDFDMSKEFEHVPNKNATNHAPCNCLPECSDLFYRMETSEGTLERDEAMSLNYPKFFEYEQQNQNYSVLHVYFIDLVGTLYLRNMYYTWHQLLASIGGILSLFLGFSLISALEVIYFFSIRVWIRHKPPSTGKNSLFV